MIKKFVVGTLAIAAVTFSAHAGARNRIASESGDGSVKFNPNSVLSLTATNGSDNAGNPAYSDGWATGDNGGTGFQAWNLFTTGTDTSNFAGVFIGNSTTLATPGADINTTGASWGMFGTGTAASNAERSFDTPLDVGQTFSIDLAVNFRNGFKGLDLRDASGTIFNFNIGGDDYVVNGATTGNGSIGNTYSDNTAFNLSFTQTSASGGTWTITRSGGVSDSDSGTYTGVATSFKLYVGGTGGGDANNLFANNATIVPEPSTLTLLAGPALLGGWFFLRRRRAS